MIYYMDIYHQTSRMECSKRLDLRTLVTLVHNQWHCDQIRPHGHWEVHQRCVRETDGSIFVRKMHWESQSRRTLRVIGVLEIFEVVCSLYVAGELGKAQSE